MTRILILATAVALMFLAEPAFSQSPPDSDSDGFSDGMETYIGTSPASRCIPYENGQIDAWPPDFDRDGYVTISDITYWLPFFGTDLNGGYTDPTSAHLGYRFDLAPEPMGDGVADVTDLVQLTGRLGSHC